MKRLRRIQMVDEHGNVLRWTDLPDDYEYPLMIWDEVERVVNESLKQDGYDH